MNQELKHWDLRGLFTAEQVACLAIGIDPAAPAGDLAPGKSNGEVLSHQARTILRDIQAAAAMENACAAQLMFRESRWAPDELPPRALLSVETYWAGIEAEWAIEAGERVTEWRPAESLRFPRARVAAWFRVTGFQPAYDFGRVLVREAATGTEYLDEKASHHKGAKYAPNHHRIACGPRQD